MTRALLVRLTLAAALTVGPVTILRTPAEANGGGTFAVTGTMNVGSGMAYPCLAGTQNLPFSLDHIDPNKCLGPLGSPPNSAAVTFSGTAAGGFAHGPVKAAKAGTAESGTYLMSAIGSTYGSCDFNTAVMSGSTNPTISVGTKQKARTFVWQWFNVGGLAITNGYTSKGEHFYGILHMSPTGGYCLNKDPKTFTVVGVLGFARV
jgi:hypothetical protein